MSSLCLTSSWGALLKWRHVHLRSIPGPFLKRRLRLLIRLRLALPHGCFDNLCVLCVRARGFRRENGVSSRRRGFEKGLLPCSNLRLYQTELWVYSRQFETALYTGFVCMTFSGFLENYFVFCKMYWRVSCDIGWVCLILKSLYCIVLLL